MRNEGGKGPHSPFISNLRLGYQGYPGPDVRDLRHLEFLASLEKLVLGLRDFDFEVRVFLL